MADGFLKRLLALQRPTGGRPRLFFDEAPAVVYAIGDVHGCYGLLRRMEEAIIEDAAAVAGEKWIVMLGDYVDRGPQSAAVLSHLLAPPPAGFVRHCLAGNHEALMLSYLEAPDPGHHWLALGGTETLRSYGLDEIHGRGASMKSLLGTHIPPDHHAFLRRAPCLLSVPGFAFVHAGIRPGIPLDGQSEHDLLWLRPDAARDAEETSVITVHGHTPVADIEVSGRRINIDTGAFFTGRLSCARVSRNGEIHGLVVT